MPHTDVKPNYKVEFTADEYRLVTMALAGLLKDGPDIERALELNEHMCHQRAQHLQNQAEIAAKALEGSRANRTRTSAQRVKKE